MSETPPSDLSSVLQTQARLSKKRSEEEPGRPNDEAPDGVAETGAEGRLNAKMPASAATTVPFAGEMERRGEEKVRVHGGGQVGDQALKCTV